MPDAVSCCELEQVCDSGKFVHVMTFSFFCSSLKGQSLFEKKWLGGARKKVSFVGMGRSSEA